MKRQNTRQGYGLVAKLFHWTLALYLIGMLGFGTYLGGLKLSLANFYLFGVHKSLGILAFSLIVMRLLWTLINRPPPLLTQDIAPAQVWLARLTRAGLYACMIAMPLTGWIASSAAVFDMRFFNLFPIPKIVATNAGVEEIFFRAHALIGKAFIALVALHIAGALLRHFVKHDTTLRRMWF